MPRSNFLSFDLAVRLAVTMLFFTVAVIFFAPHPGSKNNLTFDPYKSARKTSHTKRYLMHQDGLNSGKGYLVTSHGHSVTKKSADDIGVFVWQANLHFLRNMFSDTPQKMSYRDLISIRMALIGTALALIILLRNDLVTALLAAGILATSDVWESLRDTVIWPNSLSVIIAVILLYWLCVSISKSRIRLWDYLSLMIFAVIGGTVGTFRAGGAILLKQPFLIVFIVLLTSLLIMKGRNIWDFFKFKASNFSLLSVRKFRFTNLNPAFSSPGILSATALVGAVVIGSSLVAPTIQHLNIKFYEHLDNKSHLPDLGGRHVKWGPLYAGLGTRGQADNYAKGLVGPPFWSNENIFWNDCSVRIMTSKETGTFTGWNKQTEEAAKKSFFRIFTRNTPFVVDLFLSRVRLGILTVSNYFIFTLACLAAIGCIIARAKGLRQLSGLVWILGSCAFLVISLIPFLASPKHKFLFLSTVMATGIFSFVFCFKLAALKDILPSVAVPVIRATRWFLLAGLLAGLALMLWVNSIQNHREALLANLQNNNLSLEALFNEYHADATYAFNNLSKQQREEIARSVIGKDDKLRKAKIEVQTDEVLYVSYNNDYIFVLVKVDKRLTRTNVFPIQMKFKKNNYNMTTDVMALPYRIEPGVWLLSFRMPSEHIDRARIKAATPFKKSFTYITPKEALWN